MANADEPASRWIALGFTDDVTDCELCGKQHLKGTVRMEAMTADGESEGQLFAGTTCAGKLTGRTASAIRSEAKRNEASAAKIIKDTWREWDNRFHRFTIATRDAHFGDGEPRASTIGAYYESREFQLAQAAWLRSNPAPQPPPGYEHVPTSIAKLIAAA
jgi:5-hydroxyisourate hydrolase-like protein (transthyretin family)